MSTIITEPISGFIETKFGNMHYKYYGDRKSPVMVCCNGFLMDMGTLQKLLPQMLVKTDVLICDYLGQGLSEVKTPITPTVQENSEFLKQVIFTLSLQDLPIYLFGISSGGFIALEFAKNYPQIIDKVILMSTSIFYSINLRYLLQTQLKLLKNNQLGIFLELFYSVVYSNNFLESIDPRIEELKEAFIEKFSEKTMILHSLVTKILEYNNTITEKSYRKIETPMLYIYGDEDIVNLSLKIAEKEQMLPKAKFVGISGAAHYPIIEKQKDFFNVVDKFL